MNFLIGVSALILLAAVIASCFNSERAIEVRDGLFRTFFIIIVIAVFAAL